MVNIPKCVHPGGFAFLLGIETDRIGNIVGHAGPVSSSEIRKREQLNYGASNSLRSQRLQKAHVCRESCFLWSA
jgi:hypothetical protein